MFLQVRSAWQYQDNHPIYFGFSEIVLTSYIFIRTAKNQNFFRFNQLLQAVLLYNYLI